VSRQTQAAFDDHQPFLAHGSGRALVHQREAHQLIGRGGAEFEDAVLPVLAGKIPGRGGAFGAFGGPVNARIAGQPFGAVAVLEAVGARLGQQDMLTGEIDGFRLLAGQGDADLAGRPGGVNAGAPVQAPIEALVARRGVEFGVREEAG
jgi:hypothetical protein